MEFRYHMNNNDTYDSTYVQWYHIIKLISLHCMHRDHTGGLVCIPLVISLKGTCLLSSQAIIKTEMHAHQL